MPQKVLKFTGINRKVNEFQGSGACEELINLRPEFGGGHRVVKPKKVTKKTANYKLIYEHTFGAVYNQIVVADNGVVWWIDSENRINSLTTEFVGHDVEISSAGNVLVIYCEDTKKQLVYRFKNEQYEKYNIQLKPITNAEIAYAAGTTYHTVTADDDSAGALNSALQKAASGFHQIYPNGLCGYAVIGCTYELKDGSELWSTAFVVANSEITSGFQEPKISGTTVSVTGARKVYLCLSLDGVANEEIRKINVYASRPVFQYTVENEQSTTYKIVKTSIKELNLDGQVMYYQGSVNPEKTSARVLLNFSMEEAASDIMDVDAGCIERIGNTVSFNNRFHCYNSTVNHIIQIPTVSRDSQYFILQPHYGENEYFYDYGNEDSSMPKWVAYVKFDNEWKLINKIYNFYSTESNDFIYPMGDVKQLAFVRVDVDGKGEVTFSYNEMFYVNLSDSSAYNYSYAFDVIPSLVPADDFKASMQSAGQTWDNGQDKVVFLKDETNALNVSAQFNPFVFPVKYSYSFGGEIKDIVTAYLPISSTQIGQYPLTVFTSNGIYALEQGSGATLYGNISPLQPLVIEGKATATPYGTFFVSSKALYILSGRESENVSYILNGPRELTVRGTDAYKMLCNNKKGVLFDFSNVLSNKDFEDYISDVTLTYDQLNNELIISSNDSNTPYSYVFNLGTKSYHKVSHKYISSSGRYALQRTASATSIVDLHTEESGVVSILMQSRPLPLDIMHTHVQRLLMMLDAHLEGSSQNLCVSVFGSDNLNDWKCIISSQKKNAILRQIRTNRAAKSYKDYIILVNGTVSTDTDISEIIMDYSVVNRHLG